jgi:hypothetical protein
LGLQITQKTQKSNHLIIRVDLHCLRISQRKKTGIFYPQITQIYADKFNSQSPYKTRHPELTETNAKAESPNHLRKSASFADASKTNTRRFIRRLRRLRR